MKEILERLNEIYAEQGKVIAVQERNTKSLDRQWESLEKIRAEQAVQNETLARNTSTLEEHHRRSLALEEQVKLLKAEVDPIKTHVHNLEGVGKFMRILGYSAGAITAVYGVFKLITTIMKTGL